MTITQNHSPESIAPKQHLLENARHVLKTEFIGIDDVIDSVIDSLTTWFLFPELQERPLVINLWGMTGVGKTALVLRLGNLLQYEKKLFRFDMGNSAKESRNMKDILKELFRHNNGKPYMLVMDEFQYARTKNEQDFETDNHYSRVLWDLLDSGKFEAYRNAEHEIERFVSVKKILQQCLQAGVTVKDGWVTSGEANFLEIIAHEHDEELEFDDPVSRHLITKNDKTNFSFLPINMVRELYKYSPKKNISVIEFRKMIYSFDGPETVALIEKTMEYAKSNRLVDCSRALIFILGNLDDAYRMSSSFNPDIHADDFHEASKLININHIKKALKKRFRMEQVSRLGNNHIIYPAFSRNSFEKLISMELEKTAAIYREKFGIAIGFSGRFRQLIYQEGVYPTQGTRPLYSTIYQMVNTRMPLLMTTIFLKCPDADKVCFEVEETNMLYLFFKGAEKMHELQMPLQLNLEKLRAPGRDDVQAITAVHESGHAVISMAASGVLPDYICSTTADAESSGFVMIRNKWNHLSKEDAVKKIAEFLGGLLAEKLVFGEEKMTRGAEQDIERATALAGSLVKDYGMGNTLASIDLHGFNARLSYLDKKNACNEEVKALLEQGKMLAEKILIQEKTLLLQLADHLSDERIITKEEIAAKAKQYASAHLNASAFIEDGKHLFYRERLKNQLKNKNIPMMVNTSMDAGNISLNRQQNQVQQQFEGDKS